MLFRTDVSCVNALAHMDFFGDTTAILNSIVSKSYKYLLLTEFEVRTVSYGPSFFPFAYGPSAKRTGHKSTGKKRGSVTYSADRENEVSKIFIISLRLIGCAEKEIFKVSWPYSKVRPEKLTNHSARTN